MSYPDILKDTVKSILINEDKVYDLVLDKLEENVGKNQTIGQHLLEGLEFLSSDQISMLDLNGLTSILHPDPSNFKWISRLENILSKTEKSIPIIDDFITNGNLCEFNFARKCLLMMGKDINYFIENNSLLEIYNVLNEEVAIKKINFDDLLFNEKTADRNRQHNMYEYGIETLLNSCGLQTLWVHPLNIQGIDVVAYSPYNNYILLIDCTTGTIPNEKFSHINETRQKLISKLINYELYPIIFVNKKEKTIMNRMNMYSQKIGLFTIEKLEVLYEKKVIVD